MIGPRSPFRPYLVPESKSLVSFPFKESKNVLESKKVVNENRCIMRLAYLEKSVWPLKALVLLPLKDDVPDKPVTFSKIEKLPVFSLLKFAKLLKSAAISPLDISPAKKGFILSNLSIPQLLIKSLLEITILSTYPGKKSIIWPRT